jgi:XapX domain-containing protein
MKTMLGLLLAFGVVCHLAGLPLPAPLALTGAALVLAMSAGYEATDRLAPRRAAVNRGNCGGPDAGVRPSQGITKHVRILKRERWQRRLSPNSTAKLPRCGVGSRRMESSSRAAT